MIQRLNFPLIRFSCRGGEGGGGGFAWLSVILKLLQLCRAFKPDARCNMRRGEFQSISSPCVGETLPRWPRGCCFAYQPADAGRYQHPHLTLQAASWKAAKPETAKKQGVSKILESTHARSCHPSPPPHNLFCTLASLCMNRR